MHKKISHLDARGDAYKPITDRYFLSKKIILEVEDSCTTANTGDHVCIDGYYYIVETLCLYPEILIQDIELKKVEGEL